MAERYETEFKLYPYRRSADQEATAPVRHKVVVIGGGPVGMAAALDLGSKGVPVLLLDDHDGVRRGSRAICFSKRTLEIADRLGFGDLAVEKGVVWSTGKVFLDERQVFQFDLLPETGHRRPAFVNLQQPFFETYLFEGIRAALARGAPIEVRGMNAVTSVEPCGDHVVLNVETPDGPYTLEAEWVLACDGASSPTRKMLGLDFIGRVFEDNFLIADVKMKAPFPTERWFWFDPPFNRGQSALLHKQPDGIWRIDLQLGKEIDRSKELQPENISARLRAMLGTEISFELVWTSIYTFQCRRMEKFRHGRILFCGDAAHQVSPFGARGANGGLQDVDNLCWKLKLVLDGAAPTGLLDSYDEERIHAADENILNSSRSTDFITPKSAASKLFRDSVLNLAEVAPFAQPLVNSGRLSVPAVYEASPLNTEDGAPGLPKDVRPGAPAIDAPLEDGWLLDRLGNGFQLVLFNLEEEVEPPVVKGVTIEVVKITTAGKALLAKRYLGKHRCAIYLLRPDQHVAARWTSYDASVVAAACRRATGLH